MAKFLALIYDVEANWVDGSEAELAAALEQHSAFGGKHGPALRGGDALRPTSTARTIRDGSVTDGPFQETKEALGGYYAFEADDMDAAVEIAKDVPAGTGCVEVREVWEFS